MTNPNPKTMANHCTAIGLSVLPVSAHRWKNSGLFTVSCSPDQPPAANSAKITSGERPSVMRKNCKTSLKIAEEDHEDGEQHGVEPPRRLVVAPLQVTRHGDHPAAVVERDHEQSDEHHGGYGAYPVEVGRHDPVLG